MPRPWPWCPLRPWRAQRSIISRNSPRRPLTGTITYSLMWFIPFLHVIGQVLSRYIANRKSSHCSLAASGNHAYSRGQEDAGFQEAYARFDGTVGGGHDGGGRALRSARLGARAAARRAAAHGRRLRLRAREPGRLLDQRGQARLPDVERERGRRQLLRDGRIDGGLHRPDRSAA